MKRHLSVVGSLLEEPAAVSTAPRTLTVLQAMEDYLPLDHDEPWEAVMERTWASPGFHDLVRRMQHSTTDAVSVQVLEDTAWQVATENDERLLVAAAKAWTPGWVLAYRVDA